MIDRVNMAATWRSARLAARGSVSAIRCRCAGIPGFSNNVGAAVEPGTATARSGAGTSSVRAGVVSVIAVRPASVPVSCSLIASRRLRAEPHGTADQGADAHEPDEQALGHGPEVAQRRATRARL